MRVAFIGSGFVADYYLTTLQHAPGLSLAGVYDHDKQRLDKFCRHFSVRKYRCTDEILADQKVDIVVNLTNPRSHYAVSRACLDAGKHVYSEKPLGMTLDESRSLIELARRRNVVLASAPCSLLGESAQTLWHALREERVGKIRLVYAEMDDGLVHAMPFRKWRSVSGAPWPYKDEFEVGCTLEHAGYYLSWLTAFFGPAKTVTAFAACLVPDKCPSEVLEPGDTADFSVACIVFASGVVARLTCGIVAPHDHSLTAVGDDGILGVKDCWFFRSPVYMQRRLSIRRKSFISPIKEHIPLRDSAAKSRFNYRGAQQIDFARGIVELADAVQKNRRCRLSDDFALHNIELALAIQNAKATAAKVTLATTFTPPKPMEWAL